MADRSEHYRKFGPLRSEATDLVMLDFINSLRQEQGMPPLTQQEFLDRVENHLSHLTPYPWMEEQPPI